MDQSSTGPLRALITAVTIGCGGAMMAQDTAKTGTVLAAPQLYEMQIVIDIAQGDVDGDGEPDVILATRNDTMRVDRFEDGSIAATFMGGTLGGQFRAIDLFDWNGDGNLDIGVAKRDAPGAVWLGDGAGLVASTLDLEDGTPTRRDVAGADLDGDGHVDALFAGSTPSGFRAYLGDGAGGVLGEIDVPTGQGLARIAPHDLDGDGDLDVLCAQQGNLLTLFNEDGRFVPGGQTPTVPGAGPRDLTLADLDGEPGDEVVFLGAGPDVLLVFDILPDGSLALLDSHTTGSIPRKSLLADLNGDGIVDLAVPVRGEDRIEVRSGLGDGTFDPAFDSIPTSADPMAGLLTDVDGDGLVDVYVGHNAAVNPLNPDLSLLGGTGVGRFLGPVRAPIVGQAIALDVVDVDGDGPLDVVVCTQIPSTVRWLRGVGQHTLQHAWAAPTTGLPLDVAAADLNGDGHVDVVVPSFNTDGGVRTFAGPLVGAVDVQHHPTQRFTRQVAVADLDLDGGADVVSASQQRPGVHVQSQSDTPKTSIDLEVVVEHLVPFDPGVMELADLTNDGLPDVIIVGDDSGLSRLLITRLDGGPGGSVSFVEQDPLPPLQQTVALGVGDIDGDGDLDLAVAQSTPSQSFIRVLTREDGLTFVSSVLIDTPPVPHDVHVVDLDEDGLADLLTTASKGVMLHRGLGELAFTLPQRFDAGGDAFGSNLFDAVPVDIDGDRHDDVVIGSTEEFVAILPNRASPWWNVGGRSEAGPALRAEGPLGRAQDLLRFRVAEGVPFDTPWLVTGLTPQLTPSAGSGQLVPAPDALLPLVLDEDGEVVVPLHAGAGVPIGVPFWVQCWSLDGKDVHTSDALFGVF